MNLLNTSTMSMRLPGYGRDPISIRFFTLL